MTVCMNSVMFSAKLTRSHESLVTSLNFEKSGTASVPEEQQKCQYHILFSNYMEPESNFGENMDKTRTPDIMACLYITVNTSGVDWLAPAVMTLGPNRESVSRITEVSQQVSPPPNMGQSRRLE